MLFLFLFSCNNNGNRERKPHVEQVIIGKCEMMINIGDAILIKSRFSTTEEVYKAMVVEIEDGGLFIDYPVNVETGKIAFLPDGMQLEITITDSDQAVHIFESEVLGRIRVRIPMIQLLLPPENTFIRIQRRQYVRLEVSVDAAVHPQKNEFSPFKTITEDISAGGVAIRLPKSVDIKEATNVKLWLVLPLKSGEIHYLSMKGRITRLNDEQKGKNILSIQFIDATDTDTKLFMRFIFEKQMELKKRGII